MRENLQQFIDTLKGQLEKARAESERWRESDAQNFARVTNLEAENARLQERVEEAQQGRAALRIQFDAMTAQADRAIEMVKQVMAERDGYKARDKLRGEALELEEECMNHISPCPDCFMGGTGPCDKFIRLEHDVVLARRAAIDTTPEEAREKERR